VAVNSDQNANADETWTVRRILDWTTGHLEKHGSETARLDAEILLAHARGCTRIDLYTHFAEPVTETHRTMMRDLVKRRANAEPVAYLVGYREFFSLDFSVTPDVLIPRPDTETLVVELLESAKQFRTPRILEIGTGSGCIAITAKVNHPRAKITATDLSAAALEVARKNARAHQVVDEIFWLEGDLFDPVPAQSEFEIIASNPPYLREDEMPTLQKDVALHEPTSALVAGPDGLEILRRIAESAYEYLVPGGKLLFEIAYEQAEPVREILNSTGHYDEIGFVNDLSARPRVVTARRCKPN
jgi:release factor glutamine methyltransferase